MAASQSTAQGHCAKCGTKHSRPVGIRCKRLLNISAPVLDSNSELGSDSYIAPNQMAAQQAGPGSSSSSSQSAATGNSAHTAKGNMEAKLDLILQRMDALEDRNLQLEQQVEAKKSGKAHRSHTARQKSHTSVRGCVLQLMHPNLVPVKNLHAILTPVMTASQSTARTLAFRRLVMTVTSHNKCQ